MAVGKVFQFPKNILDWMEELGDDIPFAKLVGTTRILNVSRSKYDQYKSYGACSGTNETCIVTEQEIMKRVEPGALTQVFEMQVRTLHRGILD